MDVVKMIKRKEQVMTQTPIPFKIFKRTLSKEIMDSKSNLLRKAQGKKYEGVV